MDSGNKSHQGGRGGRGRAGYSQESSGGGAGRGRGRGRGRGTGPQDQSSGGYSGGQYSAPSTYSHSRRQGTDEGPRGQGPSTTAWRQVTSPGERGPSNNPWGQGTSSISGEQGSSSWGQGRGTHPLGQGTGVHPLGVGRGASIRGLAPTPSEPVAQSSAETYSTPAVQASSIAKVVEGVQSLRIEPKEEVAAEESAGKKSRKKKKKGASKEETPADGASHSQSADQPSSTPPVPSLTTKPSDEAVAAEPSSQANKRKQKGTVEPQPSTSAQTSGTGAPSTSGTQSSTSKDIEKQRPEYKNIPKRRKQGSIHAGSKYFDPRYTENIEVNYLPISYSNKDIQVYHYDVEFSTNANKEICSKLVAEMRRRCFPSRHPTFDGKKNLYAARSHLFNEREKTETISIRNNEGIEKEYRITVKKVVANVELTISSLHQYMKVNGCSTDRPQSMIQALEVALRSGLSDRFVSCGRGLYEPRAPQDAVKLSDKLLLYSGFVQSSVLGSQPFVNIDVSHRGFHTPQTLIQYLKTVIEQYTRSSVENVLNQGLSKDIFEIVDGYVRQNNGLKMRYIDPRTKAPRTYRIKCLCRKNAMDAFFDLNDVTEGASEAAPRRISVFDYFRHNKGYTIRYPKLPVIQAGRKDDYFPFECCQIEDKQPVPNSYRYSREETQKMIANCKDLPQARKQKILSSIQNANFRQNPVLQEFGITVNDRLLQVEAASLLTPNVMYKDGPADIDNGVWQPRKFVQGCKINTWMCVNMNRRTTEDEIGKLQGLLMKNARDVGMEMASPLQFCHLTRSDESSIEKFFQDLKMRQPYLQLVMLILPYEDTDLVYRRVKYVSEIKVGLLTQCIKPLTVQKVSWMTARNLLMKINSKLAGLNHITNNPVKNEAMFDGSTMFVGADVTHPRPGTSEALERSISAVAGSYDVDGSKYKMLYHIQKSREEMIQGMEDMIQVLLKFFKKNNGKFPTKMYYYRDGVSDGQFWEVLSTELWAIKQACKKLGADVRVTFLVVQKRHHTRFFPKRGSQLADKKGNVYAGTVVNSVITHPFEHDFYMVSHQSIQGTARPTKYHVLYDEIGQPEDYIEALTYYLCYMFVRCTRAVSYPAPTYYAHLAAARAEKYVKCVKDKNSTNLDSDLKKGPLGEGTIHEDLSRNPMYYT